ncbi:MAG: hypothetical protein IGR80_15010 [Synechococcales cyanobacterium K44_A2020_017]|nr:hypothetical protein [Synechococcales cyanobacterium K32_A2020_035]MBF2096054.1 hypothetical protein [Synechococcales cyanobacterium K44_A2020_017]
MYLTELVERWTAISWRSQIAQCLFQDLQSFAALRRTEPECFWQASRLKPSFEVPLRREKNSLSLVYGSAIALKHAPHGHLSARDLAQHLTEQWSLRCSHPVPPPVEVRSAVTLRYTETGWLMLHLCDRALSSWINLAIHHLADGYPTPPLMPTAEKNLTLGDRLWPIQHGHARCQTLRTLMDEMDRLSDRPTHSHHTKNHFALHESTLKLSGWDVQAADPLSLDPVEKALLYELVEVVDHLAEGLAQWHLNPDRSSQMQTSWLKLALGLCDRLQQVDRHSHLFDPHQTAITHRQRQRLLLLTQLILAWILQTGFGQVPAAEL